MPLRSARLRIGFEVLKWQGSHEPALSQAVAWFLSGLTQPFLELKKGGVCVLDFPRQVKGGGATLLFALRPGQLRRMR